MRRRRSAATARSAASLAGHSVVLTAGRPPRRAVAAAVVLHPLGGGRAAINGDFVLTADRTGAVIETLRSRGISIVELHGHLLYERPRLFFLHFWATGDAVRLARDLRAALDLLR